MSQMLSIENVDLTYPNGNVGLAGIDLEASEGELVAVIGPSGSGKTTLLRAVAGFLNPTAGRITIGDQIVFDGGGKPVPPERRRLGMVFQQHAIWPHMSVEQNVQYPLKLAKVDHKKRQQRADEVLEMVGLAGYGKRDPSTLSGGQRQRVALARALVNSPRMLLLDEALSALDEPLRDSLRLELRSLASTLGLTMLHVTHDRNEAIALADRMLVLDQGRIMQSGSAQELLENPANPFIAKFLSDAAAIPGTVTNGVFHAEGHELQFDLSGSSQSASSGSGELIILPQAISVKHYDENLDSGYGKARVTSSLFGREYNEVVLGWHDMELRCRYRGEMFHVGDTVQIRIDDARFYPKTD